jgi:hypothetical protein
MDKDFLKELSSLMDIAQKLSVCSLKKCNETAIKVKENREIMATMMSIMFSKDMKKKQELIAKISANQDVINNELCMFNNCKDVYIKYTYNSNW